MNERKNTEWSRDNNSTSKDIGFISVSDLIINIIIHSGVSFRLHSLFKLLKNWFYHSIIILIIISFTIHSQISSNYLQTRSHHQSSHSLIISYSIHIHSIYQLDSIMIIWFLSSNCDSEWFFTHHHSQILCHSLLYHSLDSININSEFLFFQITQTMNSNTHIIVSSLSFIHFTHIVFTNHCSFHSSINYPQIRFIRFLEVSSFLWLFANFSLFILRFIDYAWWCEEHYHWLFISIVAD